MERGIALTATDVGPVLEPGTYRVKLVGTEQKEGTRTQEMPDGSTQTVASSYIRWEFAVTEEGFEGTTLRANSSMAFGPQSKARGWAETLLRKPIEKGTQVYLDDLVGLEAMAAVKDKVVGDKVYSEIVTLTPVRMGKGRKASVAEEEDGDIPF